MEGKNTFILFFFIVFNLKVLCYEAHAGRWNGTVSYPYTSSLFIDSQTPYEVVQWIRFHFQFDVPPYTNLESRVFYGFNTSDSNSTQGPQEFLLEYHNRLNSVASPYLDFDLLPCESRYLMSPPWTPTSESNVHLGVQLENGTSENTDISFEMDYATQAAFTFNAGFENHWQICFDARWWSGWTIALLRIPEKQEIKQAYALNISVSGDAGVPWDSVSISSGVDCPYDYGNRTREAHFTSGINPSNPALFDNLGEGLWFIYFHVREDAYSVGKVCFKGTTRLLYDNALCDSGNYCHQKHDASSHHDDEDKKPHWTLIFIGIGVAGSISFICVFLLLKRRQASTDILKSDYLLYSKQ